MFIQKILPYDVYENNTGTSRYHRVVSLLAQSIDPETLFPDSLECGGRVVYTSPKARAVSCIQKRSASSATVLPELNEIAFRLDTFCTEKAFLRGGSESVRRAFVQAFIEDKLATPRAQLQQELDYVMSLRNQQKPPLCISHTFRMKLLAIYADIGDKLFQNPSIIKVHIDCTKHLYDFGEIIEI